MRCGKSLARCDNGETNHAKNFKKRVLGVKRPPEHTPVFELLAV
jgi:hypothetical protein